MRDVKKELQKFQDEFKSINRQYVEQITEYNNDKKLDMINFRDLADQVSKSVGYLVQDSLDKIAYTFQDSIGGEDEQKLREKYLRDIHENFEDYPKREIRYAKVSP